MFNSALIDETTELLNICKRLNITLTTAESCTGGMISALLTEIPGSSAVIHKSYVTYANTAKHAILGVASDILKDKGAVSEEVVRAMAEGAVMISGAHISVAVSGIAGPDGGTTDKPVGTVHFATHYKSETTHDCQHFGDLGRHEVRMATVEHAINMLVNRLN